MNDAARLLIPSYHGALDPLFVIDQNDYACPDERRSLGAFHQAMDGRGIARKAGEVQAGVRVAHEKEILDGRVYPAEHGV